MTRYHVNNAGDTGVCRAKTKCPFGDMESDHYDSAPEARAAYEAKMADGDSIPSVSRESNRERTGDVLMPRGSKVLGKRVPTVRAGVAHIRAEYAKVEYARDVTPEMVAKDLGEISPSQVEYSYFEPDGDKTYLVIESYDTHPIGGPEPIDYEEYEDNGYEPITYKSRYAVDEKTAKEIEDYKVKRHLENIVETSHRKDLPMWAALPANKVHYPTRPSSMQSQDPEKAARRVTAMENKIRGLENNLKKDEERAKKLVTVREDVATLTEAAKTETRPVVREAIEKHQASLEADIPKLEKTVRRANPDELKKELRGLKKEAKTANEDFSKVLAQDFKKGLASHHPDPDPRVRARAAEAWIKENPSAVKSGWNYSF